MMGLSRFLFFAAFAAYVLSSLLYVFRLLVRRQAVTRLAATNTGAVRVTVPADAGQPDRAGIWASRLLAVGVAVHGAAIILRWLTSGQAPMSNMYEYMSLTAWSAMAFYTLLNYQYKVPALGAFVAPIGVVVIAYASLFPSQVQPLIPALQSYWLVLHVSFAALGEGAFAVGFAAAVMYLLRVRQPGERGWSETALEAIHYLGLCLVAFLALALTFRVAGFQVAVPDAGGATQVYHLPPVVAPAGVQAGSLGSGLPLLTAPGWMQGVNAARKLNTMILSLFLGTAFYALARLMAGRSLREQASQAVAGLDPHMLDDLSYRAVAVGFPLFTLGGMVFAMIWAQKAWGAYWSWDPKETWSLISWLFYSGYLHLRIMRGWQGRPAAWVATLGFTLILFTLVGVNLLITGLHSYAG